MDAEEAADVNARRAQSHIGEFCPSGCIGRLTQIAAVGYERDRETGGDFMTIEYECSTGHRRIFCREPAAHADTEQTYP